MELLSPADVSGAEGLADWRVLPQTVHASFATGSFARSVAFTQRIGEAADAADHHPDLVVTYPRVRVALTTHDAGGLTARDVELARTISDIARELGIEAEPTAPAVLEVAVDALDIDAVRPFWRAVYGLDPTGRDDEVVDPMGRLPTIWFQQMEEPRRDRNRLHLDLWVGGDVAEDRVAAARAAGGALRSDAAAPAFWVLADPEGNEVCVCTAQDPA